MGYSIASSILVTGVVGLSIDPLERSLRELVDIACFVFWTTFILGGVMMRGFRRLDASPDQATPQENGR